MVRFAISVLCLVAIGLWTTAAKATNLAVLFEDSTRAVEQRVAVSHDAAVRTLWWSMRVNEATDRAAVVVMLPAGSTLELTSGWFDALDAATAPRIIEPAPCEEDAERAIETTVRPWASIAVDPTSMVSFASVGELEAWAADAGFVAPPAEFSEAGVGEGSAVALLFEGLSAGATATIRWSHNVDESRAPLDSVLRQVPATLWSLDLTRTHVVGASEVRADALGVTWPTDAMASDYDERRDDVLVEVADQWIVEAAGPPLRRAMPDVGFIPSLYDAYDNVGDDLTIALGDRIVSEVWVTRLVGRVEDGAVALETGTPEPVSPVLRALSSVSCGPAPPVPAPKPTPPPRVPDDPPPVDVVVDSGGSGCDQCTPAVDVVVEASCSGDSFSGDACSGDSSGSEDACSGDTSGSEDDCSGDSSGSGDDCSGDSSGSDDACSGDSSGSEDACSGDSSGDTGDSCSGDSSSSCAIGRLRGVRKVSTVTYLLAAIAFAFRRSGRRPRVSRAAVATTKGTVPKMGFWLRVWRRAQTTGYLRLG